ncbi:hypothetical protein C7N77_09960 [Aeromonas rivipollensis]|nr:hypothetical protein C7N77_09960 [Aeromonas rivipollensis]
MNSGTGADGDIAHQGIFGQIPEETNSWSGSRPLDRRRIQAKFSATPVWCSASMGGNEWQARWQQVEPCPFLFKPAKTLRDGGMG